MIRRLSIRGLGPHDHQTIKFEDPLGVTTIRGASETGKTTLITAVCFVLWGIDARGRKMQTSRIRDGADECRVELELTSGTKLTRTLKREPRRTIRVMNNKLGTKEYRTEPEWRGALRSLGSKPKALRYVLVPHAWQKLADGEGGGRPLRDLLANILPKADKIAVIRRLMGAEFREGDPVSNDDALDLRRRTKLDAATQRGDFIRLCALNDETTAQVDDGVPEEPTAAREVVALEYAWAAFAPISAQFEQHLDALEVAVEARKDWERRRAEIGDRPEGGENAGFLRSARDAARQSVRACQQQLQSAQLERRALVERQGVLRAGTQPDAGYLRDCENAFDALRDAASVKDEADDVCPTCERDGWDGAREAAQLQHDEAATAHADALRRLGAREEELAASDAAGMLAMEQTKAENAGEIDALEDQLEARQSALETAEAKLAAAALGRAPVVQYDAAVKALGPKPEAIPIQDAPLGPTADRPAAGDVAAAREAVAEYERAVGAQAQREANSAEVAQHLDTSEGLMTGLEAECERLEALVEAVRRAPSIAAAEQMATLGDLGPVTINLPEEGGAEVLVDGRPYDAASTGRLLIADLHFRRGLRKALKVLKLPLFVDCVQNWSGTIPQFRPAVWLRTDGAIPTDGSGPFVVAVR